MQKQHPQSNHVGVAGFSFRKRPPLIRGQLPPHRHISLVHETADTQVIRQLIRFQIRR